MEKIFQIVLVFVLLMLIIARFLRGPGSRYRAYDYQGRRKPPLPEDMVERLLPGVPGTGRPGRDTRWKVRWIPFCSMRSMVFFFVTGRWEA